MKKIYFLDESIELKNLKNKIINNPNKYSIKTNFLMTIIHFILEFFNYIINFFPNFFNNLSFSNLDNSIKKFLNDLFASVFNIKKEKKIKSYSNALFLIIINGFIFFFIFFIFEILDDYILSILFNINTTLTADEIVSISKKVKLIIITILTFSSFGFFGYYIRDFVIGEIKKIDENYGLLKDKSIIVKRINNKDIILSGSLDTKHIINQIDFILDLIIEINKIEGSLDLDNKNLLNELIKDILKYNEYLIYFDLLEIENIDSSIEANIHLKKLIQYIQEIDSKINELKETKLYKINFGKDSKKLKATIENRYNYITRKIEKFQKISKTIKDKEIKKTILKTLKILEKEEIELNQIRKSFLNISMLKKKVKVLDKLNNELSYIDENRKKIKELEIKNDKGIILNRILNV